jgi:hypothetical protein
MSTQSYLKLCDGCQEKILMQQVNGKWGAYTSDGTAFHKCNNSSKNYSDANQKFAGKQEEKAKEFVREVMKGPTLEERVARLEKFMNLFLTAGS